MRSLASAAAWYARNQIAVFPLHERSKAPRVPTGFKAATDDVAAVEAWWRRWPEANIGMPTGVRFDVIDVDSTEGFAELFRFTEEDGRCLSIVGVSRTSKGAHYFVPATNARNATRIRPGVDVRGAGGYVVLPPSVHESGHVYEWEVPLSLS